jgi:hypothetical protein
MVPLSPSPLWPVARCNCGIPRSETLHFEVGKPPRGRERPPFARLLARQNAGRRYGVTPGHVGEIVGVLFPDPRPPSCKVQKLDDLHAALTCNSPSRTGRECKPRWEKLRLQQLSDAQRGIVRSGSDRNWPLTPPENYFSRARLFSQFWGRLGKSKDGPPEPAVFLDVRFPGTRSRTFSANCKVNCAALSGLC